MSGVPFNKPGVTGREVDYIREAIRAGHLAGDGLFTEKCRRLLEQELQVPVVLLTTSCTHALELAALLLDIQPGDEVVMPSHTFVSTANAFVLRGARPVFVDVHPDTLNMDESLLEASITSKCRAIVPVHYAGVGCEMDAISEIASRRGIPVVEDAAQGLFGKYKGRSLGSFGVLAALSFHDTKNIQCGEGGALLVNDASYVERAEVLREKGTDRARFLRGEVDKYGWVDVGSSYLPSELVAAFLFSQLESREAIQKARRRIWETYQANLAEWAEASQVGLPVVPPHCEQTYHMYYLVMPNRKRRDEFIGSLRSREIQATTHYRPLHLSPMGRRWGYRKGDLPVTEDICARLVRLPFYNELTEEEQTRVCEATRDASRTW